MWTQRGALLADLVLIWWLWRKILSGREPGRYLGPRLLWAVAGLAFTLGAFVFSWTIATFPGEWLEEALATWRFAPVSQAPAQAGDNPAGPRSLTLAEWTAIFRNQAAPFGNWALTKAAALHEAIFNSEVNQTTLRRWLPFSRRSNPSSAPAAWIASPRAFDPGVARNDGEQRWARSERPTSMIDSQGWRAVLGIDAAWTERQPSGVALAVEAEGGWRLAAVEASYAGFLARAGCKATSEARARGDKPDAAKLLDAARSICGRPVDLIAVDMPMARHPIVGRRPCDNQISSKFGAAGAATHSPNGNRPGRLSDALRAAFEAEGYALRTRDESSPLAYGLVEVYPHAALIRFFGEKRRLEYKAGKTLTYWPKLSRDDRRVKLRTVWTRIVEALEQRIAGVAAALPPPEVDANGWRLKAYEDKLDAVVCAAVAITALDGEAEACGDGDAAIWVPCGDAKGD